MITELVGFGVVLLSLAALIGWNCRLYERMAPVMGMMQGDQAALREFFCGGLAQVMLRALGSSLQGAELFAAACSRSLVLPGVWKGAAR